MPTETKNGHVSSSSHIQLLPWEDPDIRKDVAKMHNFPTNWLSTPNSRLGGEKPEDLIGTDREQWVRDILRSYYYGLFS
jgi:hypothetical protein